MVDGDDILIPGLCVSFMENGYETTITTDIRVKVEFTRLDVETPVPRSVRTCEAAINRRAVSFKSPLLSATRQSPAYAMGEAYTYVLTHYSPDNDAQLKAEVKKNLFYKLTGTPYGGDKSTALVDKKFLETCDGEETLFYGVDPAVYGTGLRLLNLDPVGDIDSLYAVVDGDDILIPGLCVSF